MSCLGPGDRRASARMRSSVKVNLLSTESTLNLKNILQLNRQRTKLTKQEESKGGFDMEENKKRIDLMRAVWVKRTEVQEKYMNRIKAFFNPLNIL